MANLRDTRFSAVIENGSQRMMTPSASPHPSRRVSRVSRLPSVGSVALALAVVTTAIPALALPTVGDAIGSARLEDADGHGLDIASFKGKPILIVYEDRDSAKQNDALKKELARLAKGDKYKSAVALAAVANVAAFNFWPVKGFVKDAIRAESKKQGTTIFCDWTGGFRKAFKLRDNASSVVLIGKEGNVLFAADGSISADARARLVQLLRQEVEGAS